MSKYCVCQTLQDVNTTFSFSCVQVSRIAAAFELQPPIYLIKEFDNNVIFPNEKLGKLNPAMLIGGATYEVQGCAGSTMMQPTQASPFGAYHTPPTSLPSRMQSVPTSRVPRKLIKKNILVASLSRDNDKPSTSKSANHLTPTVVTQIIVSLDPSQGECSVSCVLDMVKRQLGFEAILLDSKLFPLTNNESTSGEEFWRLTSKTFAVSHTAYQRLGGIVPDTKINLDDDVEIVEPSSKKVKLLVSESMLDKMSQKLDTIDQSFPSLTYSGYLSA